jgi:hypothetical protein
MTKILFKCEICKKEFKTYRGLGIHVTRWEEIKLNDYYKKYPIEKNILKQYLISEFHKRYKVVESGCWEWSGYKCQGYGAYGTKPAHRLSYELFISEIPKELLVCHRCDNTICVNPNHLYCGTSQDNMNDMKNRKRSLIGDKNPSKRPDIRKKLRKIYICMNSFGDVFETDNLKEFCTLNKLNYRTMLEAHGGKGWKCQKK